MENKRNQCNGTLKVQETPDGRDIYICSKCGQQSKFNFNIKCKKVIEKSTRELAFEWWRKLKYDSPIHLEYYAKKYYKRDWDSLTCKEVEEIWLKETNQEYDYTKLPMNSNPNLPNWMNNKPNQKQFTKPNSELINAYFNKFSKKDLYKYHLPILINLLNQEDYKEFILNQQIVG